MDWAAVLNNPFLKDLPFKIELNKWDQILMSPASNNRGRHQFNVGIHQYHIISNKTKV